MNHCKTIAIVNQKGGVGKTTSTVNLGVGLAQAGNRVLLVDDDPQHSLTISLGIRNADENLDITLATAMQAEIRDEPVPWEEGIIHSGEGVDLLPANIELSGVEMSLFNAMSREQVLKSVLSRVKENYDYILIDCMPSLGLMSINALVAADSVIIPSAPDFLSTKGLNLLIRTISRVRRQINPKLKIDGILMTMQAMGYTFKTRTPDGQPLKYPALKPPGAKGYFRFHRLGPGYSLTEILDRVYDNVRRQTPFPEADRMAKQRNPFIPYPKAKGIHALYLRYCYELRIIQKHPASVKRVPFSMRQDLILLDKLDAQTRFLAKHEYSTAAELETHKKKSTGRISELEQERNALRNQLRTATRREDTPAIDGLKNRIKEVSSEIKALRQEVKLCDGIEARSALMERNLEQLQQEQEIERKEEEQHELFRRGGRSGRPAEFERR